MHQINDSPFRLIMGHMTKKMMTTMTTMVADIAKQKLKTQTHI